MAPLWTDYATQTTPDDADTLLAHDVSETTVGQKMKRTTWANIKAAIKALTDTYYLGVATASATPTADTIPIADAGGKLAVGWMPANPYMFSVWRNAAVNSGNGAFATVAFDTEVFDTGGNISAGVFTAPVSGYYQFNARVGTVNATVAELIVALFVDNTETARGGHVASAARAASCSALLYLTANQAVTVRCYGTSAYALEVGYARNNYFSGFFVSL